MACVVAARVERIPGQASVTTGRVPGNPRAVNTQPPSNFHLSTVEAAGAASTAVVACQGNRSTRASAARPHFVEPPARAPSPHRWKRHGAHRRDRGKGEGGELLGPATTGMGQRSGPISRRVKSRGCSCVERPRLFGHPSGGHACGPKEFTPFTFPPVLPVFAAGLTPCRALARGDRRSRRWRAGRGACARGRRRERRGGGASWGARGRCRGG